MNEMSFNKCSCDHCERHIEYPAEAEGMTTACPHCSQPTRLSMPDIMSDSIDTPAIDDLLASMSQPIRKKRTGLFYQMGLMLVAVVMVLLPVIYIALIGVVAWSAWYYATHYYTLLHGMHGSIRFYLLKVAIYAGPVFAGILVVAFMIKPFFAKRAPMAQPLALNGDVERSLFSFIARVCLMVGAPLPSRIDLNCEVGASASFRRGALSFMGNDLVLTLGIPLLAGLNLGQFAAVLAHEFGHFTQGMAMRFYYIIRSVELWFARVAYERDAWDIWLEETRQSFADELWMSLMIGIASLGVWFSRSILKMLMMLGGVVTCFLSRQMEYNADACAIGLAGSKGFESTMLRVGVLSAVMNQTYNTIRAQWNSSRKLPADLPQFFLAHDAALPREARGNIENRLGLQACGAFDTHPSIGDRIRMARKAQNPGVFYSELPATMLFSNFEAVSRQVTQSHYQDDLGLGAAMGGV